MTLVLSFCLGVTTVCEPIHAAPPEPPPVVEVADAVERWEPLVSTQFPESEIATAMCLIRHESAGNPKADNPRSSARGLFQILASTWAPHYGVPRYALYGPVTNTRIARDIWEQQGWWAWSPYQRGLCREG